MIYPTMKLSSIFILILLLTNAAYSEAVSKNSNTITQESITLLDNKIKKKQYILLTTLKSNTTQYISLYDELAELTISKNNLLLNMDKAEDIDADKTCEFTFKYEEVEFIKTQYYKTPFHDEVAITLQNIASLYEQCHPPMAEKYFKSILTIKEHIYLKDSAEVAKAHDSLGDYYRIYMANFKRAIVEYEESKSIREKLYGIKDPKITQNYKRLALSLYYYYGDKMDKAEKLLLEAINIIKNAPRNKEFPLYVAYMDLGIHYSMKDEYPNSIIYLQKALKELQGKVNNNYIVIVNELAQIYLNQEDLQKALKYSKEAYIKSEETSGNTQNFILLESLRRMDEIRDMIKIKKRQEGQNEATL